VCSNAVREDRPGVVVFRTRRRLLFSPTDFGPLYSQTDINMQGHTNASCCSITSMPMGEQLLVEAVMRGRESTRQNTRLM
jgi:hypothetical protein